MTQTTKLNMADDTAIYLWEKPETQKHFAYMLIMDGGLSLDEALDEAARCYPTVAGEFKKFARRVTLEVIRESADGRFLESAHRDLTVGPYRTNGVRRTIVLNRRARCIQ